MAGLLAHQIQGQAEGQMPPEEVMRGLPHGVLLDLLARLLSQTGLEPLPWKGGQQEQERRPSSAPEPTPNKMKDTKGPLRAETPRRYARERDRLMREIP